MSTQSVQEAQPISVRGKVRLPHHLADFIDPADYRKISGAIIKLSGRWEIDYLARLSLDGEWLPIELIRLLHREAPTSLEAFRIYLSDGLVGYNDQFSDEDVQSIRSLITTFAELGEDISVNTIRPSRRASSIAAPTPTPKSAPTTGR
jgi:hypothetical protein